MCVCVIIKEEGGKERSTLHWVCVCVVCALGKHQKGRRKGGKTRKLKEGGVWSRHYYIFVVCPDRPVAVGKKGGKKRSLLQKNFSRIATLLPLY